MANAVTIYLVYFDYGKNTMYDTMRRVCVASIERNYPDAKIVQERIPEPVSDTMPFRWMATNTDKLERWNDFAQNAKTDTVLLDCDTLVLRDFSEVFNDDYDVGITRKTKKDRFPLNGGVVFVRNTTNAKRFMTEWLDVNNRMVRDGHLHLKYRRKYAGMNQAALGWMLENTDRYAIKEFPCALYNKCEGFWDERDSNTAIVHYKGMLRESVFDIPTHRKRQLPKNHYLVELYNEYRGIANA